MRLPVAFVLLTGLGCSGPTAKPEPTPATERGDAPGARSMPVQDASVASSHDAGVDQEVWDHISELGDEHEYGRAIAWLAAHAERARPALYEVIDERGRRHYTRRALRTLAVIGDPIDVPKIVSLLTDPDKSLQRYAVTALSNHAAPEALVALTVAIDSEIEDVSTEAMAGIARRKHEPARPALERALGRDNPIIRGSAAWTLHLLGAEPSRPALEARLEIEQDTGVRKELRRALGE